METKKQIIVTIGLVIIVLVGFLLWQSNRPTSPTLPPESAADSQPSASVAPAMEPTEASQDEGYAKEVFAIYGMTEDTNGYRVEAKGRMRDGGAEEKQGRTFFLKRDTPIEVYRDGTLAPLEAVTFYNLITQTDAFVSYQGHVLFQFDLEGSNITRIIELYLP